MHAVFRHKLDWQKLFHPTITFAFALFLHQTSFEEGNRKGEGRQVPEPRVSFRMELGYEKVLIRASEQKYSTKSPILCLLLCVGNLEDNTVSKEDFCEQGISKHFLILYTYLPVEK